MVQRVKLTVAYLGTPFGGWQRQPDHRSIQGELEMALAHVLRIDPPPVVGAGRTDAGVHARAQSAHVDLTPSVPIEKLAAIVNNALPTEIRIRLARRVSTSFHARFSAHSKHYAYRLAWKAQSLPWLGLRSAVVPPIEHLDSVRRAMELLEGNHNVASFSVPDQPSEDTSRILFRVWAEFHHRGATLHFLGDGFLRYQVRRMVGALLELGGGQRSFSGFQELLKRPQPGAQIRTAPAKGLTLERVYYRVPGRLSSVVDSGLHGSQDA